MTQAISDMPELDDVIGECEELCANHAKPLLDALECVSSVEHINDAEANIADALHEARELVKALEVLSRGFKVTA